jgi:hypothetical protein
MVGASGPRVVGADGSTAMSLCGDSVMVVTGPGEDESTVVATVVDVDDEVVAVVDWAPAGPVDGRIADADAVDGSAWDVDRPDINCPDIATDEDDCWAPLVSLPDGEAQAPTVNTTASVTMPATRFRESVTSATVHDAHDGTRRYGVLRDRSTYEVGVHHVPE